MNEFAKLFISKKHGQILVTNETNDEGPVINLKFIPPTLGICKVAIGYNDDDEGYHECDYQFHKIDCEKAEWLIKPTLDLIIENNIRSTE